MEEAPSLKKLKIAIFGSITTVVILQIVLTFVSPELPPGWMRIIRDVALLTPIAAVGAAYFFPLGPNPRLGAFPTELAFFMFTMLPLVGPAGTDALVRPVFILEPMIGAGLLMAALIFPWLKKVARSQGWGAAVFYALAIPGFFAFGASGILNRWGNQTETLLATETV